VRLPVMNLLAANRAVLFNAGSLMGTTGVNMVLGFAFWWVAARHFSPSQVGVASAAVSTITLLGTLGMLGLGTLLIGELPRRRGQQGALIATALIAAGLVAALLGLGFAVLAPAISPHLQSFAQSGWSIALIALGSGLTAITLVLDQAVIGLLRGDLQLWRNGIFSVAKLAMLLLLVFYWTVQSGLTIFAAWVLGFVVSLSALGVIAVRGRSGMGSYRPRLAVLRGIGKAALGHHLLNVALQLNSLVMPLIITIVLTTADTAYYNAAGMISTVVYVAPTALATVLYAVGSADPAALRQRLRFTLGLALALTVAGNVLLLFLATPVLAVFGHAYAQHAALPLQIFSLGAIPICVREHYAAICRIRGRAVLGTPLVLLGALLKVGLAVVGATTCGLAGLSLGILTAGCLEAMVMAPIVYHVAVGVPIARARVLDARAAFPASQGQPFPLHTRRDT
jgi:O-antigen/teichoic acid export membrane protein